MSEQATMNHSKPQMINFIRRLALATLLVAAMAVLAAAQEATEPPQDNKFDISVSLSVHSAANDSSSSSAHGTVPAGWVLSVSRRLDKAVALVAEAAGNYSTLAPLYAGANQYAVHQGFHSFLGGLRFAGRRERPVRPFFQLLGGPVIQTLRSTSIAPSSEVQILFQAGAGADIRASRNASVRCQVDVRGFPQATPAVLSPWRIAAAQVRVAIGMVFRLDPL